MARRYPRTLSSGANNTVIALSKTEVAKLFHGDTRSNIGSEAEMMRFANEVNDLVVKFVRLDIDENIQSDLLVMERLYPMDYRAYEQGHRELWIDVFEDELKQLHQAGFCHRDLCRPSNMPGMPYDNIFLTDQGIRLIDVGISFTREKVGQRIFDRSVEQEWKEFARFREDFLSR